MYQLHFVVEPYKKNRRINSVRISETQQKNVLWSFFIDIHVQTRFFK